MSGSVRKPQYYLIACGTKDYHPESGFNALESVEDDLERVVKALAKFGYQHVLRDVLYLNPSEPALKREFAKWLLKTDLAEQDQIIFYYSGHGDSIDGDGHYLLLQETEKSLLRETAFRTDDLVGPLLKPKIKATQFLYIIDTCYAGQGIADINRFASEIIDKHRPRFGGDRKSVHLIAASRLRQSARSGVFSAAFQSALEQLLELTLGQLVEKRDEFGKIHYIQPSILVDKINHEIDQSQISRQEVGHAKCFSGKGACFFPVFPKTICNWESKIGETVGELLSIIENQRRDTLFFVNSFLLASDWREEFVLEESNLEDKFNALGSRPVVDGICPLVACSEWLKQRFSDRSYRKSYKKAIVERLILWQESIIQYRTGIEIDEIRQKIAATFNEFNQLIKQNSPRLQIELEPEIDPVNNTGLKTGLFLLYINLWLDGRKLPLARLAEEKIDPRDFEKGDSSPVDCLMDCLEKDKLLPNHISKAHQILSLEMSKSVSLDLEFFVPFEYFELPLEKMRFSYTPRKEKILGREYTLFINSYDRYFDVACFQSKEDVCLKKENLWENDAYEPVINCCDANMNMDGNDIELDDLEGSDIFIGSQPSYSILCDIEAALPIAVWSRDQIIDLSQELDPTKWKDWPECIKTLRKKSKDANITLFWDDLYPKPSERSRPLNTSVVE